ncbi:PhoX family protein [Paenibacillus sambharensis]|nr:alkaline phosphatase PhoX [Paenibacillus sambharensis]
MDYEKQVSRRSFLGLLGSGAVAFAAASTGLNSFIGKASAAAPASAVPLPFPALQPVLAAKLITAGGFKADQLAADGTAFKGGSYGIGGGFISYFDSEEADKGLLWINHTPAPGGNSAEGRGASVVSVKRTAGGGWKLDNDSKHARRITPGTRVELTGPARGTRSVNGASSVQGLWTNGTGGRTPWGTVLAGEQPNDTDAAAAGINPASYGWLAEADPADAGFQVRKHTALGRFTHGQAASALASDGRAVIYMSGGQVLYKFISSGRYNAADGTSNSSLLEKGTLYAANISGGEWIELDIKAVRKVIANPAYRVPQGVNRLREDLLSQLRGQADVLVYAQEAALVLGATRLDRAAGAAVHPADGSFFLAQTGSEDTGSSFGSILRLIEENGDAGSLRFEADPAAHGGRLAGFSSPSGIAFDESGKLWVASDMPASRIGAGAYAAFGSNSLQALPPGKESLGSAEAFAYAPEGSAFSLPAFGPGGTVFTAISQTEKGSTGGSSLPSGLIAIRKG